MSVVDGRRLKFLPDPTPNRKSEAINFMLFAVTLGDAVSKAV